MPQILPITVVPGEICALRAELGEYPNLDQILCGASPEAQKIILKILIRTEQNSRRLESFRKLHIPVA